LIISMQQHQKYFPLADAHGKLQARFLFVANVQPRDFSQIVHGNERVVRPRLADAKFFYDQDRKTRLAERVPRLAHVVYHNKLGSQLQRVARMQVLAAAIALKLKADPVTAERAFAKADCMDMAGEPGCKARWGATTRCTTATDGSGECDQQHHLPRSAVARRRCDCDQSALATSSTRWSHLHRSRADRRRIRLACAARRRCCASCWSRSWRSHRWLELARQGVARREREPQLLGFFDRLRPYLRQRDYAATKSTRRCRWPRPASIK
jgi:hypothetical protein